MEAFDYDETFMGVSKKKDFHTTFIEDYRLQRLTEFLELEEGKLLDIGCGGGITTEALSSYYPNVALYGCDVSSSALKYAQKYGSGKVVYKQIIKNKLPFKDNYFDACIALDVIEHVPNIDFFLEEINRVLKKKGQFFSHTPVEGQPFTLTWFWGKIKLGSKMTYKRYGHIHPELTQKIIQKKIKSKGFNIIKVNYSEHLLFQLFSLFFYFLPLELLDFFLKKDADLYKDKNIIKSSGQRKNNPLMLFRNFWLLLTKIVRYVTYAEVQILKGLFLGALKINILAIKK